ncbi:hypothetical protein [Chrysiogenes arsenatis]|uniref:hypothetical protein n=1 Tax=Chrysiogenes arsenatis TaxID=309797 RepID=UPI0004035CA4|nr:hypothetical protein [Chrysiogenes arsenatis]
MFDIPIAEESQESQTKAAANPFDLTPAKNKIQAFSEQIDAMTKTATAHQIENEEAQEQATAMATQAKKIGKAIDSLRKEYVQEPNEYVKAVNNFAKSFTDRLDAIERDLKQKMSAYLTRRELETRKAQEAARKAQEELQRKLDEEAKDAGVETVQLQTTIAPQAPTVTRTDSGSSHTQKVFRYKGVADLTQVPLEFLIVDEKKVNQAIRSGIRNIPGLTIEETTEIKLRTA